jgi:hypothetical protein
MYKISEDFMKPFLVRKCPDCGLHHAPIRTCEETREWAQIKEKKS